MFFLLIHIDVYSHLKNVIYLKLILKDSLQFIRVDISSSVSWLLLYGRMNNYNNSQFRNINL